MFSYHNGSRRRTSWILPLSILARRIRSLRVLSRYVRTWSTLWIRTWSLWVGTCQRYTLGVLYSFGWGLAWRILVALENVSEVTSDFTNAYVTADTQIHCHTSHKNGGYRKLTFPLYFTFLSIQKKN